MKFGYFLDSCKTALERIPHPAVLDDSQEDVKLLKSYLSHKSGNGTQLSTNTPSRVDDSDNENLSDPSSEQYPPFEMFCKFIRREATKAYDPISSYGAVIDKNQKSRATAAKGTNSKATAAKNWK